MKRMLDLFCGRFGWSKAFAARGWECIGIDLVEPPEIPAGCTFVQADALGLIWGKHLGLVAKEVYANVILERMGRYFDFICASSPCEQFSIHGMKHFHPNPPYPELGIKLFNHTRELCEASGVPYVMENVRSAQAFIGTAKHHCGPFYLWGTGVPPLLNQGIKKDMRFIPGNLYKGNGWDSLPLQERRDIRTAYQKKKVDADGGKRSNVTARTATIPPELSSCVADYAEALLRPHITESETLTATE